MTDLQLESPTLPVSVAAVPRRRATAGKVANVALWILQVAIAAAFIMAGTAKILGAPPMVELFDRLGFGVWFRYFTGAVEIAGAILLLVPSRAGIGGLWLAGVMVGAVATHLFLVGGDPTPAAVLLALSLAIAWFRRDRTMRVLREARDPSSQTSAV